MSDLARHLQDYLRLRRALGFKLAQPGHVLPQFVTYLDTAGATTISVELAIAWAGLPVGVTPISLSHRLGAVRGFARYLGRSTRPPPCRRAGSTVAPLADPPRTCGQTRRSARCSKQRAP